MVGFNRRFAPQVVKMRELLAGVREPKAIVMTVNAGAIPPAHWTQDADAGGGRIIGEACHFIDMLRHLAGAAITSHHVAAIRSGSDPVDRVSITLGFADGSIGTIHYLSNGHRAFPKERLEVFAAGRVLQLDNFRRLKGYGWPGFSRMNLWRQDKGQDAWARAFVEAVRTGGPSPIPLEELLVVARVTIARSRRWSRRLLGQNAVVLLISDGLDADAGEGLAFEMERLAKSCRRLVWLNPLLRYAGFEPKPAGIRAMLPYVDDFRPVHNLASLEQVGAALRAGPRARPPRPAARGCGSML